MFSDRVCHRHCHRRWVPGGFVVLPDVPAGVRLGDLLDRDPQPDMLWGLTAQLSAGVSPGSAAATDPFLGIPSGVYAAISGRPAVPTQGGGRR